MVRFREDRNLACKVRCFSKCYQEATKLWRKMIGLPEDVMKIKSDPYLAMIYLTGAVHERTGANPNFPKYHRLAIQRALKGRDFSDTILHDLKYPDRVWSEFSNLTKERPNEKLTKGVVRDLLEKLREKGEANVIRLLGSMKIKEASRFLRELNGIGPKLSAFILRDLESFFGLWTNELKSDNQNYYLLQPIDRWVERIANLCWPGIDLKNSHDKNAKNIVEKCINDEINPIEFNQGAWFVGAYFNKLLLFHGLVEQELNEDAIKKFDPNKVTRAIRKFKESFIQRKIFSI